MDRTSWVRATAVAGLVGVGFWGLKLATILIRGESGHWVDEAAFGIGLLGILVGSTSLAVRLTRRVVTTVVGCVLALIVVFLLLPGLTNLSVALFGEDTFAGSEGGLMVLALAGVVIGVTGLLGPRRTTSRRQVAV